MPRRSLIAIASIALLGALGMPSLPWAGGAGYAPVPTDLYSSPEINGLGIPTGGINVSPGKDDNTTAVSVTSVKAPTDVTNYLGCGGVGQGEFTTGLYNMPETFGKFQTDVNSLLAKQILAMNFIMPQTGALFDQLNNYGNQSYQSFQTGCKIDPLKQDAKNQIIEACVIAQQPKREKIIKDTLTGDLAPKPNMLAGMAYAQAWEICTNQYISDTTILAQRKTDSRTFAQKVRDVENVTLAIEPLLCPYKKDGTNDLQEGCWQTLLIPQVRLCLDASMGCTDAGGYKINEPVLNMQRLFDLMRFVMDDTVINRSATKFTAELELVDDSTLLQAARDSSLNLSYAGLFRVAEGSDGGKLKTGNEVDVTPDVSVYDYQLNYLNCKQPDIVKPLKVLKDRLAAIAPTGAKVPTLYEPTVGTDVKPIIDKLELKGGDNKEISDELKQSLRMLVWTSLGCTANQSIPIFDPVIVANLNTKCQPADRNSFYTMAGYDTAFTSTQNIYRYLNIRLKQAYTRLLVEGNVPVSATTAKATSPTFSPELNRRMADVIKEAMIPYVENQLARLQEVNNSRGEFAKRVQRIYADRRGCFTPASGGL